MLNLRLRMRSQRKFNKEKNQKGRQSIRRVESGSQETLLEKNKNNKNKVFKNARTMRAKKRILILILRSLLVNTM